MKNNQHEINRETTQLNRIKAIYKSLISCEITNEARRELVCELLSMQNEDGSWGVTDAKKCDSDIRVCYIYFPTYYATAALMNTDLAENYSEHSQEKKALAKGLSFAMGRRLRGHGYDATHQMLDALRIYKNAGLYRWINLENNSSNAFCKLIRSIIAKMRDDVKTGNTVSGWNVDFVSD